MTMDIIVVMRKVEEGLEMFEKRFEDYEPLWQNEYNIQVFYV